MSKISSELAGMPGSALEPYASFAGIERRRSLPACMPATPMSQPLITSPTPSLKEKGFPFLLARNHVSLCKGTISTMQLTIELLSVLQLANVAHLNTIALLGSLAFALFLVFHSDTTDIAGTFGSLLLCFGNFG